MLTASEKVELAIQLGYSCVAISGTLTLTKFMDEESNCTNNIGTAEIGPRYPDFYFLFCSLAIVLFYAGLLNLLAVAGLTGNMINIIVLCQRGVTKDSINVMPICLSFFDFMYSSITIISDKTFSVDRDNSTFLFCWVYLISQVCTSFSVTITSAIAIERFVAVFFPFKVGRIFTPARVKLVVTLIFLYVCCIVKPIFGRCKKLGLLNTKKCMEIVTTESVWWVSNNMSYYSQVWVSNLLGTANMTIVFLCGTTTALKLTHTVHTRQRLTNKTSVSDIKAHKMILIVCGTCFLVFLPTTAPEMATHNGLS